MVCLRLRSASERPRSECGWLWARRRRASLYLSVLGIAIGLLAALALTRVLTSMLVEVKPTDPATFVFVAVLFLFIAVMASWLPALRAAELDPTTR